MLLIKDVSELTVDEIIELIKIYHETGEIQWEGDILARVAELWDKIG